MVVRLLDDPERCRRRSSVPDCFSRPPMTALARRGEKFNPRTDLEQALKRRFVFEPGMDRPIVHFEISNGNRVFLSADERGSIISRSLSDGSMLTINTYDEYGIPGSANDGRFQYTGQSWLAQLGMYYYKARMYSPTLGRFMQTDPIGMAGGPNPYAYVGNDPVNRVDPSGTNYSLPTTCTGTRINGACGSGGIADGLSGFSTAGVGGQAPVPGSTAYGGGGYWECTNCNGTTPAASPGDIVVNGQQEYRWVSTTTFNPIPPTRIAQAQPKYPRTKYDPKANYCTLSPDAPGGIDISQACHSHDDCYASGTAKSVCDQNLYNDIFAECRRQGYDTAGCSVLAAAYYGGVQAGGRFFYEE